MQAAEVYYVARRLRGWLEARITEGVEHRTSLYVWVVVRDVLQAPGSGVREISHRLGMAQSMVSKALAQAEARGWVSSVADPRDRRRRIVYPSNAVRTRLEPRLSTSLEDLLEDLFGPTLAATDRVHLHRALELLHQRFKVLEDTREE